MCSCSAGLDRGVLTLGCRVAQNDLLDLEFDRGRAVVGVSLGFWELFHCVRTVIFCPEPHNGNASLAQDFDFLITDWTTVTEALFFVFRQHNHLFSLLCGLGRARVTRVKHRGAVVSGHNLVVLLLIDKLAGRRL